MNSKKYLLILFLSIFCVNLFSQSFESGQIMYVNSLNGLRIREEPSINSRILGINIYGQCIWLHERSNSTVTIDGITDYWYRSSNGSGGNGWVFGGYLSQNIPPNIPIISGIWEIENIRYSIYSFSLSGRYWIGQKESGGGRSGNWEILGSTLILKEEGIEYKYHPAPVIYRYNITIINNNRIILQRINESDIILIRCTNFLRY